MWVVRERRRKPSPALYFGRRRTTMRVRSLITYLVRRAHLRAFADGGDAEVPQRGTAPARMAYTATVRAPQQTNGRVTLSQARHEAYEAISAEGSKHNATCQTARTWYRASTRQRPCGATHCQRAPPLSELVRAASYYTLLHTR